MTPEIQFKLVFCRILLVDCGLYKYFSRFQKRLLSRAFELWEKRRRKAHYGVPKFTFFMSYCLAEGWYGWNMQDFWAT